MKFRIFLACLILVSVLTAQYQANWESLDQKPVPEWFTDAKFGVFIHWGPYSVPAWSPKGTYAEWYQYWLQNRVVFGNGIYQGDEVYNYHNQRYGPHFSYYRFGEEFKADLFNPSEWQQLLVNSGAKYVIITAKHHDGYSLWPSEEANDRGFYWNSVDTGPRKDLLKLFSNSIRKTDLHFGVYYSLYEWFHPLWNSDKELFVAEHFQPQFKDLVENYQPDILWGDGEWDMTSAEWKTPELIAWLYNESVVRDKILINDRWGSDTRKKHGGYYTTEYNADESFQQPWEECRGMGFSFGYNRNESIDDYNSARSLILMLADIVSRGGNLLLNIGPDGRGQIPVIMQERLLQIGRWLALNGEAIYGTRPWKNKCQWTVGRKYGKTKDTYSDGDFILKKTVSPDSGFARKEILFTAKKDTLYAICPKYPAEKLLIKNLNLRHDSQVQMIVSEEPLQWENRGTDLQIQIPAYDPEIFRDAADYAYVFKIVGVNQKKLKAPLISVDYATIQADPVVTLKTDEDSCDIYYTLDGSRPDTSAIKYQEPVSITKTLTLKAICYDRKGTLSLVSSRFIKKITQFENIKLVYPPHKNFQAEGAITLCDGIYGDENELSGKYLGFHGKDMIAEITLPQNKLINSVAISALNKPDSAIIFPREFEIYKAVDNINFEYVKKKVLPEIPRNTSHKKFILEVPIQSAGAIRVFVKNYGKLPSWHPNSGEDAWLFIDEITVQ
ncbi:MAG: alpha-L-fucosidase [Fidelibacterota bacterium]